MSKKPETRFWENKVKPRLEQIPGIWFTKVQMVSIRGIPDILGCYRGKFFAFEMKVRPNKLKVGSLQWHHIESINRSGGLGRELTPENLDRCIEELLCLDGSEKNPQ